MKKMNERPKINIFYKKKIKIRYNIKKIISDILKSERKKCNYINIIFVNDKEIKKINADFRLKNSETDVISFSSKEKKYSCGDIFISVDTAKNNAKKYKVDLKDEILRLVIHGILHVLGYDHTDVFGKKEVMNKKQEKYLKFLKEH